MSFDFNICLIQLTESQIMAVCSVQIVDSLSHTHIDNSLSWPNNRSFRFNLYTFCLQLPTSCPVYNTKNHFYSRHKMQPIAETARTENYTCRLSFQIYAKTCSANQFPSSSIRLCTLCGCSSSIHASQHAVTSTIATFKLIEKIA